MQNGPLLSNSRLCDLMWAFSSGQLLLNIYCVPGFVLRILHVLTNISYIKLPYKVGSVGYVHSVVIWAKSHS